MSYVHQYSQKKIAFSQCDTPTLTLNHITGWEQKPKLSARYLVSDRCDAWKFSKSTLIMEISELCCKMDNSLSDLDGKRILILVFGYTSTVDQINKTLHYTASKTADVYDAVVAYVYPSGTFPFYSEARDNALLAAPKLRKIINSLSYNTQIDIAAHSMGVYLTLNALNAEIIPSIFNLFLMGGADRQESLNACMGSGCTTYHQTLENVNQIFAFVTCQDWVLPFHTLGTGQQTIGRPSVWSKFCLSDNVKVINTTNVVNGHSDFWENDAVLNAIISVSKRSLADKAFVLGYDGSLSPREQPVTCRVTFPQYVGSLASNTSKYVQYKR